VSASPTIYRRAKLPCSSASDMFGNLHACKSQVLGREPTVSRWFVRLTDQDGLAELGWRRHRRFPLHCKISNPVGGASVIRARFGARRGTPEASAVPQIATGNFRSGRDLRFTAQQGDGYFAPCLAAGGTRSKASECAHRHADAQPR
jgi:hypothetical protein